MPAKKKQKLLPGQKTLSFSRPAAEQSNVNETVSDDETGPCGQAIRETGSEPASAERETRPSDKSERESSDSKPRHFQKQWLLLYPWLRYDKEKDLMFCNKCEETKKINSLTKGTNNFRTSTITRHLDTEDHKMAIAAPAAAESMKTAQKQAFSKKEEGVLVALKVMYWMCKEGLPLVKFRSLMDFLKHLQVPNIQHLDVGDKINYTSNDSADNFLSALSTLIDKNITEHLKKSL